MPYLLKVFVVIVFALQTFAGAFAVAQVIFKANLVFAAGDAGGGEVKIAGPQGDIVLDKLEEFPHPCYTSEGAQVL